MAEKNEKINEKSWQEFVEESSMHGLKYVWNTEISLLRRVIWALLILGGSGYILTATYMFLDNFSNKLLTTKISIKNTPNLTFPTITICNQNFWKKSMFEQNFRENSEAKAVWREIMRDLYISKEPPADDKYNWSAPYLESAAQPIGNDEVDNFLSSRAHSINETFIRCMLLDNEAPCNEIFELKRTDSGYCAQFNGKGDVISHSAGVSGGLRLYLDAKVDEYYVGPNSFAEGFSISVHDSNEIPLISELSYGATPGLATKLLLQKRVVHRYPPPADKGQSDCFDAEKIPNPLHYHKAYSYSACYDECKVSYAIRKCGCRDYLQPGLNGSSACGIPTLFNCVNPALREFGENSEYLERCNCKSKCRETRYSALVSTLKFPSSTMTDNQNQSTIEYMRNNHAAVLISYAELSYELIEENLAYPGVDFIANLGGTMGVCLGASLLTLIELLEFIILKITWTISKKINNNSGSVMPIRKVFVS